MTILCKPQKLLHKALLGTAILLLGFSRAQGTAIVEVPAGYFDRYGNYFSGAMIWKPVTSSSQQLSYEKAKDFCEKSEGYLPTQTQLTAF